MRFNPLVGEPAEQPAADPRGPGDEAREEEHHAAVVGQLVRAVDGEAHVGEERGERDRPAHVGVGPHRGLERGGLPQHGRVEEVAARALGRLPGDVDLVEAAELRRERVHVLQHRIALRVVGDRVRVEGEQVHADGERGHGHGDQREEGEGTAHDRARRPGHQAGERSLEQAPGAVLARPGQQRQDRGQREEGEQAAGERAEARDDRELAGLPDVGDGQREEPDDGGDERHQDRARHADRPRRRSSAGPRPPRCPGPGSTRSSRRSRTRCRR